MKGKYLITCDNWFVAPDGHSYLAVWGDCETVTAESALGLVPNRNSANWFVKVSNNGEEMIVAGCQIHYAASCPERPNTDDTEQNFDDRGKVIRDTKIYIPGEVLGKPEREKMAELMPEESNVDKMSGFLAANPRVRLGNIWEEDQREFLKCTDFPEHLQEISSIFISKEPDQVARMNIFLKNSPSISIRLKGF